MSAKSIRFRQLPRVAACICLLWAPVTQAALQAQINPNPVYTGNVLVLTLSSATARKGAQPDLSPLQRDFEVLGTSSSSQFSMVNGRTSALSQWRVQLRPLRSGDLTIPSLQAGAERSEPITVRVADRLPPAAATRPPVRPLSVAEGVGGPAARTAPPAVAPPTAVPAAPAGAAKVPQQAPGSAGLAALWPWLAATLLLLAAVATVWTLRRRRTPAVARAVPGAGASAAPLPPSVQRSPDVDRVAVLRALESACREQNAAAASGALLRLGALQWPDDAPRNLADMAGRLAVGAAAVRGLERHLYGAEGGAWPAGELWRAAATGFREHAAVDARPE